MRCVVELDEVCGGGVRCVMELDEVYGGVG